MLKNEIHCPIPTLQHVGLFQYSIFRIQNRSKRKKDKSPKSHITDLEKRWVFPDICLSMRIKPEMPVFCVKGALQWSHTVDACHISSALFSLYCILQLAHFHLRLFSPFGLVMGKQQCFYRIDGTRIKVLTTESGKLVPYASWAVGSNWYFSY